MGFSAGKDLEGEVLCGRAPNSAGFQSEGSITTAEAGETIWGCFYMGVGEGGEDPLGFAVWTYVGSSEKGKVA